MEYRTGNPTFDEWDGLWKSYEGEPDVSRDEYERVFYELDRHCRRTFSDFPKYLADFYIRGDYTGDRTQLIEINTPRILNLKFLNCFQRWLNETGKSSWRIAVPTYLTKKETVLIYPGQIRISDNYEQSLEEGIRNIAARMKDYT